MGGKKNAEIQAKANRKNFRATLVRISDALENFQMQRLESFTAEEGFLDVYSGFQKYVSHSRIRGTCLLSPSAPTSHQHRAGHHMSSHSSHPRALSWPSQWGHSHSSNALVFPSPVFLQLNIKWVKALWRARSKLSCLHRYNLCIFWQFYSKENAS